MSKTHWTHSPKTSYKSTRTMERASLALCVLSFIGLRPGLSCLTWPQTHWCHLVDRSSCVHPPPSSMGYSRALLASASSRASVPFLARAPYFSAFVYIGWTYTPESLPCSNKRAPGSIIFMPFVFIFKTWFPSLVWTEWITRKPVPCHRSDSVLS